MGDKGKTYLRYGLAALVLLLLFPCAKRPSAHRGDGFPGSFVKAGIDLDFAGKKTAPLETGYNYELLHDFARSGKFSLEICVPGKDENLLDSLREGSLDLLVLHLSDTLSTDGLLVSIPVDNNTVWAVMDGNYEKINEINSWLSAYLSSKGGKELRNRFFRIYNPRKLVSMGRSSSTASPYDSYFKESSKALGWDWRLLAAVAWQESQYKIQAVSPRGAGGLMQMMPGTAKKFGVEDILDPCESIRAGASYLMSLQKIFSSHAPDRDSLTRLTLAAYNMGEGNMLQRLEDSLQTGPGVTAYVDSVLSCYDCLRIVCPQKSDLVKETTGSEPTPQDQPSK